MFAELARWYTYFIFNIRHHRISYSQGRHLYLFFQIFKYDEQKKAFSWIL